MCFKQLGSPSGNISTVKHFFQKKFNELIFHTLLCAEILFWKNVGFYSVNGLACHLFVRLSTYLCVITCLYVCMYAYLSAFLSVCLLTCLPACLHVILPVSASVCLSVCLPVCLYFDSTEVWRKEEKEQEKEKRDRQRGEGGRDLHLVGQIPSRVKPLRMWLPTRLGGAPWLILFRKSRPYLQILN